LANYRRLPARASGQLLLLAEALDVSLQGTTVCTDGEGRMVNHAGMHAVRSKDRRAKAAMIAMSRNRK